MDFKTRMAFFNGKIKPEFGNIEQIKELKSAQEREAELTVGKSIEVESDINEREDNEYLVKVIFNCVCGCQVTFEGYSDTEDDIDCLDDRDGWCWNCSRQYKTYVHDFDLKAILI